MHAFFLAAAAPAEEGSNDLIKVVPGLMIWTVIAFLITLFVLKRWAFGPIQKTIDERRERIKRAIDEADDARAEARKLLQEHRELLAQARGQAEDILVDARRVAEAQRQRVKEETEEDRKRRLEETKRQIDAETKRSLDAIRSEVADLTLAATARVTGKVLDAEDQRRLIDEALAELDFAQLAGGSSNGGDGSERERERS
jgi:F-type H+-transporting ATPase subunit b